MERTIAPEWKTVKEYAEAKGVTVQAVYKWVKQEKLNWAKKGSMYLVKD